MKPRGDAGAPAALKAIEEHEVMCRSEKDEAQKAWKKAQVDLAANADDEILLQIERRTHNQYLEELEIWDDATKKLALFDKQVVEHKREGVKILVTEAQELFAQFKLSIHLAIEDYMICIAQDAARGLSAEEFHHVHAEHLRERTTAALSAAVNDGKLPNWTLN